jgi:hypothetical protein
VTAAQVEWTMPVAWQNLSQDELEHAVRNGWVLNVGQAVEHIYAAGLMASYYAWGRFDQGHDQIAPYVDSEGFHRSKTDDVLAFKILCERARRDMFAGLIASNPSVQDAWATFVETAGTAVR